MGQTGIGIMENDEALDIHYLYFEKYNAGKSPSEIENWFRSQYPSNFSQELIEDNSNFWIGLAMTQWETGALSPFVNKMILQIIDRDIESDLWGDEYVERKKHLERFYKKISKEKKSPKKPVKQRLFKAPFKKGDIITSPIYTSEKKNYSDKWGILICLGHSEGLQKTAKNLFLKTTFCKNSPATVADVNEILVNREDDEFFVNIFRFSLTSLSKEIGDFDHLDKLQYVGNINIEKSFDMSLYPGGGGWRNSGFPDSKKTIPLNEIINKPDSPYTEWAELIVLLNSLPNEEERNKYAKEFKKVSEFMSDMKNKDLAEFNSVFVPFIENYMCLTYIGYTLEGIDHTAVHGG